jgi:hypothetical protein
MQGHFQEAELVILQFFFLGWYGRMEKHALARGGAWCFEGDTQRWRLKKPTDRMCTAGAWMDAI